MAARKKAKGATGAASSKITFHYIKSPHHHVAHVDGAYGAVTPQGLVAASLFSERIPIATETTHSIDGTMVKSEPDTVKGKTGIVREIDVTAVLTPEVAKRIGEWLIQKGEEALTRLEKSKGKAEE